jgi:hypothetical protein
MECQDEARKGSQAVDGILLKGGRHARIARKCSCGYTELDPLQMPAMATEAATLRTLILPFLRFRQSCGIVALPVLATSLTAQEVIRFSGTSIVATDARTGSIRRAAFKRLANRRT